MAAANPGGILTQEEQISSKKNFMHFKKIVATIVHEYASRHLKKEVTTIDSTDITKYLNELDRQRSKLVNCISDVIFGTNRVQKEVKKTIDAWLRSKHTINRVLFPNPVTGFKKRPCGLKFAYPDYKIQYNDWVDVFNYDNTFNPCKYTINIIENILATGVKNPSDGEIIKKKKPKRPMIKRQKFPMREGSSKTCEDGDSDSDNDFSSSLSQRSDTSWKYPTIVDSDDDDDEISKIRRRKAERAAYGIIFSSGDDEEEENVNKSNENFMKDARHDSPSGSSENVEDLMSANNILLVQRPEKKDESEEVNKSNENFMKDTRHDSPSGSSENVEDLESANNILLVQRPEKEDESEKIVVPKKKRRKIVQITKTYNLRKKN